ncbi:MAG: glycosyltransferase family 4 protein [Chlorobiaceae bacterium]|nr:glycosyltransferase family 4 protein [Chlorobiaceae bacterium]
MEQKTENRRLCIAYAAGPGDIVGTFSCWQNGTDDPNQVAVTYSSLFFKACQSLGARGVAISSCPRAAHIRTDQFYVENMPKGKDVAGLAFHLQQIRYLRRVIQKALDEGADIFVMADSTGHFFPFSLMAPARLKLIPTLHCTLWPRFRPLSRVQKIINLLNRHVFTTRSTAILAISQSVETQVRSITGNHPRPIYPFLPQYRKELFSSIIPPDDDSDCFNVLFAGRIETDKGVFDLLQIAEMLEKQGNERIFIHLCGNGSKDQELRTATSEKNLQKHFVIHGFCRQDEMLAQINRSHVFVVPTRTTFEEGFNKVLAEAILAGRPVITSAVCPALEYVSSAVVEVPPDDVHGYLEAIVRLSADRNFYREKQAMCLALQNQFYDRSLSWQTALEKIIMNIRHG